MTGMKNKNSTKIRSFSRSVFSASLLGATVAVLGGGGDAAGTWRDTGAASHVEAEKATWKVDSVHSCALFRVRHMGAGFFWGRFNDVNGSITFDESDPSVFSMDIGIDIESIDSGNPDLDRHLKSPDFFDLKEFPKMTFQSTSAKSVPTNKRSDSPPMAWEVTGDLKIHGKSKKITVQVLFWGAANKGRGDRAGFETSFRLKRSEFGMNYGIDQGALGDWVDVTTAFEVTK